jgi:hypothetical protein
VALDPERHIEASDRERKAIPQGGDAGDMEFIEVNLGLGLLRTEAFTGLAYGAAEPIRVGV